MRSLLKDFLDRAESLCQISKLMIEFLTKAAGLRHPFNQLLIIVVEVWRLSDAMGAAATRAPCGWTFMGRHKGLAPSSG